MKYDREEQCIVLIFTSGLSSASGEGLESSGHAASLSIMSETAAYIPESLNMLSLVSGASVARTYYPETTHNQPFPGDISTTLQVESSCKGVC